MAKKVTVIDYGAGNIFSVSRAVEHFGAEVVLSADPTVIRDSARVILPGVGAFASGMQGLRDRGLVEPVREFAATGRPFLGICLGMQMMVERSEEFGSHEGLGILPGKVVRISGRDPQGAPMKVPHIGWNRLVMPERRGTWDGTILAGLPEESGAYFVHSYSVAPEREEDRLADTWHGDYRVSAAIQRGNVSGCQFHPEKSGPIGLRIIGNFLESE